jgi:ElaB/YqjD/DUF883 family membrane-anchored ribosome-binding protein
MATRRRPASTVEDVQSDLYALREDVGKLAEQMTRLVSDKGDDVLSDVKQRVSQIRSSIDEAISEVGARGRAAVSEAKESVDAVSETLEESVRERPFTMLALAVGIGIVLGSIWRR